MMRKWIVIGLILVICGLAPLFSMGSAEGKSRDTEKLVIVWTTDNKGVAENMIFMYAYNYKAPGRWDDITLIIWGPSGKLLAQDKDLQKKLKGLMRKGITIKACKGCADIYGVSDTLASLGVDVKYMGQELTEYIKNGDYLITF